MVAKTEKYFIKHAEKIGDFYHEVQCIKRITYWLFGIIPICFKDIIKSREHI